MKLFEIAKPRVRLGPDGKYYPAPVQTVDWDPNALQPKRKRAPRKPKMVAQQQATPAAQPAAPPAPKTPLTPEQEAQQNTLRTRLQQKYNRPVTDPAVKQQQQQAKVGQQQAASLNSRLDVSRGNFASVLTNFAKANHDQIPQILRVLARASLNLPTGGTPTPNLPGRRATGGYRGRMRGEPRPVRRMNRQELDKYLQRNKIEVTEAQSIDLNRVAQIASQMDPNELKNLIKYIEDIQYEKVGPGQEPKGEYRKQPSMTGAKRDDIPKKGAPAPQQPQPQPANPSGLTRFTNWLRRSP